MNEKNKVIDPEKFNARAVGSVIDSLLRFLISAHNGNLPISEERKENLKAVIKDYCDTIVQYVDFF